MTVDPLCTHRSFWPGNYLTVELFQLDWIYCIFVFSSFELELSEQETFSDTVHTANKLLHFSKQPWKSDAQSFHLHAVHTLLNSSTNTNDKIRPNRTVQTECRPWHMTFWPQIKWLTRTCHQYPSAKSGDDISSKFCFSMLTYTHGHIYTDQKNALLPWLHYVSNNTTVKFSIYSSVFVSRILASFSSLASKFQVSK